MSQQPNLSSNIKVFLEQNNHGMGKMRIFIACADERLRIALLLYLDLEPGMTVVGMSDRLPGLITQLKGSMPDVLLLDWDMTIEQGVTLLTDINNFEFPPKIIVFSDKPQEEEAITSAGGDFVISKNAPPDKLLPMLESIRYP